MDQIIAHAEQRRQQIKEEIENEERALASKDVEMEDGGNHEGQQKIKQESDEVYSFIEKVFTRPLVKKTLQ